VTGETEPAADGTSERTTAPAASGAGPAVDAPSGSPAPAGGAILRSIRCRRCRYDLQCLPILGRCPECGAPVWETVDQLIDPDASRLPSLRDPVGVGNGLVWLAACWLVAVLFWSVPALFEWLSVLVPALGDRADTPRWLAYGSGAAVLASLWSVWKFAFPWRPEEHFAVRRDLWLLGVGSAVTALLLIRCGYEVFIVGTMQLPLVISLALAAAVLLVFWLLRRIVRIIGQRSRQWRTAQAGRQRISGLMAVVPAMIAGRLAQELPSTPLSGRGDPLEWSRIGHAVVSIGFLMLSIGLAYLLVNMVWIRRSLLNQPPPLASIVGPRRRVDDED